MKMKIIRLILIFLNLLNLMKSNFIKETYKKSETIMQLNKEKENSSKISIYKLGKILRKFLT